MNYGFRDAEGFFYDQRTNEVIMVFGYKEDKHEELNKLIKLRNKAKKKRMRKKYNSKLNMLLGR
jgi:hypothetical protein